MDIKDFKAKATVTTFNTNNGWGFGGSMGKAYAYEGLEIRQGKWCYRHAPSESFVKYYGKEGVSVTKADFEALIETL